MLRRYFEFVQSSQYGFLLCAVLLYATALLKSHTLFISPPEAITEEPLFGIPFNWMVAGAAIYEWAVATYILVNRNSLKSAILLLHLSTMFLLYRLAVSAIHPGSFCNCLGNLPGLMGLSYQTGSHVALSLLALFFLVALLRIWGAVSSPTLNCLPSRTVSGTEAGNP